MELNSIYAILVIIVLCVISYFWIQRINRQKESEFLQLLTKFSERQGSRIARYDRWNNSIIGANEQLNSFFVVSKRGEEVEEQQIILADYQNIRVNEVSRIVKVNESNSKVVDRIELVFHPMDKYKPEAIVVFYNTDFDSLHLKNELQMAEKWSILANEKVNSSGR